MQSSVTWESTPPGINATEGPCDVKAAHNPKYHEIIYTKELEFIAQLKYCKAIPFPGFGWSNLWDQTNTPNN